MFLPNTTYRFGSKTVNNNLLQILIPAAAKPVAPVFPDSYKNTARQKISSNPPTFQIPLAAPGAFPLAAPLLLRNLPAIKRGGRYGRHAQKIN
jgi:hypothetical protein